MQPRQKSPFLIRAPPVRSTARYTPSCSHPVRTALEATDVLQGILLPIVHVPYTVQRWTREGQSAASQPSLLEKQPRSLRALGQTITACTRPAHLPHALRWGELD